MEPASPTLPRVPANRRRAPDVHAPGDLGRTIAKRHAEALRVYRRAGGVFALGAALTASAIFGAVSFLTVPALAVVYMWPLLWIPVSRVCEPRND
jgi:hypothetical protein